MIPRKPLKLPHTLVLISALVGLAALRWDKWVKWLVPLLVIWVVFAFLALIPPVLFHWGPL